MIVLSSDGLFDNLKLDYIYEVMHKNMKGYIKGIAEDLAFFAEEYSHDV